MTTIDPALVEKAARVAARVMADAVYERTGNKPFLDPLTEDLIGAMMPALSAVLPDALAEKEAEIERLTTEADQAIAQADDWSANAMALERERDEARSRLARVLASVEALADEWDGAGHPYTIQTLVDDLGDLLADAQATTGEAEARPRRCVDCSGYGHRRTETRMRVRCRTCGGSGISPEPVGPNTDQAVES